MRQVVSSAADKLAFGLLVLVVFVGPFPVGSNRLALIGVTSCLLSLSLVLALLARTTLAWQPGSRLAQPEPFTKLSMMWLGLLGCVVAWTWVAPLVFSYPALDPVRHQAYQAKAFSYWCAASLMLLTVRTSSRLLILSIGIVVAGTLEALVAIFTLNTRAEFKLFGVWFQAQQRAHGTFPNADHFANFTAMSMSIGIGVMLATGGSPPKRRAGWKDKVLRSLHFVLSGRMLVRLAVVIMVIGLVLSRSRMGNASFFLALLMVMGVIAASWRAKRQGALWLGASLLVIDLLVIGHWVGLEHVVDRLQGTELQAPDDLERSGGFGAHREETVEERLSIGADAFKLALQSPWVGHGPSTFYALFPQVKRAELSGWFDHAHNDYAEMASDLGLPALVGLGGVVCTALWQWARLMLRTNSTLVRGTACGAGMAVLCMLMHAWVDFNLHIHANALLFVVALSTPFVLANNARHFRSSA